MINVQRLFNDNIYLTKQSQLKVNKVQFLAISRAFSHIARSSSANGCHGDGLLMGELSSSCGFDVNVTDISPKSAMDDITPAELTQQQMNHHDD